MDIPEQPQQSQIQNTNVQQFQTDLILALQNLHKYHVDYFFAGLYIATHMPQVGWLFLSPVFVIPTLAVMKNPEWKRNILNQPLEHITGILFFVLCSNLYGFYCLSKAFGF
jgi:hypothetical protein